MRLKSSRKPRPEPDLVPLINVVFLMLIFFLVAATLRPFSLEGIRPPEVPSKQAATQVRYAPLRLFFQPDKQLRLNGQSFTLDNLENHLPRLAEDTQNSQAHSPPPKKQTGRITIIADKNLPATALLPLLDRLKTLGYEQVKLVTEQQR